MIGWAMKTNAITIFGGSGDLTYRKLLPAMYNLEALGMLKENFRIIAIGRRDYRTEDYIAIAQRWIQEYARKKFDEQIFAAFRARVTYFQMNISDPEEYRRLQHYYEAAQVENHIYYYAVAPSLFLPITNGLSKYCRDNKAQVIVEKPFGETLESARELNDKLERFYGKERVYHIDHYLGKEMIQNILSIRFHNAIFKGIWNKDYIQDVQITAAERVGVGTRAGYYDKSGALRDMVQNHLLQVLSIVGLEAPNGNIAARQHELLSAIRPIENVDEQVIMGQYEGYLQEENIPADSHTETYVALRVYIDNPRWEGVPFYIRTGKMMAEQESKVVIRFKGENSDPSNILLIRIQPDEGVYLKFNTKKPGTLQELQSVSMDFCQSCVLENRINTPEAYERLIYSAFKQDQTLFSKWDQIVVSWNFVNDLLKKYQASARPLYRYLPGSCGPKEAERLVDWVE